jgi:hypothetical protein
MNRHQELLDFVESFRLDFEKFYVKHNKAAGTRVRKHMAALKRKAQEIRSEIQQIKQQLGTEKEQA